jgi:hypothetical protein
MTTGNLADDQKVLRTMHTSCSLRKRSNAAAASCRTGPITTRGALLKCRAAQGIQAIDELEPSRTVTATANVGQEGTVLPPLPPLSGVPTASTSTESVNHLTPQVADNTWETFHASYRGKIINKGVIRQKPLCTAPIQSSVPNASLHIQCSAALMYECANA